jgi:hypothetical protein
MSIIEDFNQAWTKSEHRRIAQLNLKAFDKLNWMTDDGLLERIGVRLDEIRKVPLLTRHMIAGLSLVGERSYQAGLLGANKEGLYRPPGRRHKKA